MTHALPLRHFLLALLVVAVWGSNFTVIKLALGTLPPLLFGATGDLALDELSGQVVRNRQIREVLRNWIPVRRAARTIPIASSG